jgi:hypothetical protein
VLSSPVVPVPIVAAGGAAVALPLTDAESELRRRADELVRSTSPFASALPPESGNVRDYGERLIAAPVASSAVRFARLDDDIASDRTRLAQFAPVAATVADRDRIRRAAAGYVAVAASEGAAIVARMADNTAIVTRALGVLRGRAAAYRFALEHLVLATPAPAAVAAEQALAALDRELAEAP